MSIFDTQPPNLRPENLGCGSLKTDVKKVKVTSKHNSILLEYNLLDSTNLLYTKINICSHVHVWRTSSEWILGWVQSTCSSGTNITQIGYWVWNNCGYKKQLDTLVYQKGVRMIVRNLKLNCSVFQKVAWLPLPFHSHKWPRQNFSLQYQYNIKQAGDENREEYQLCDY